MGFGPLCLCRIFSSIIPKHPSVGVGREESTEIGMQVEQVDNIHTLDTKIGFLRLPVVYCKKLEDRPCQEKKGFSNFLYCPIYYIRRHFQ